MHFTREPIIETIISAVDGHKLSISNSKAAPGDEYLVDAVEVVSYGGSFFYRFREKPKAFLVPVNDYQIVEVRETRLIPKRPTVEKTIKIGGGKEKSAKEAKPQSEEASSETGRRKRSRRSSKRVQPAATSEGDQTKQAGESPKPEQTTSVFSSLLTPPDTLISQSIQKLKEAEENAAKNQQADSSEDKTTKQEPAKEQNKEKPSASTQETPEPVANAKPEKSSEAPPEKEETPAETTTKA